MNQKNHVLLILFLSLLSVALLTGCAGSTGRSDNPEEQPSKIHVAATIFPLADIAQEIGGEKVAVDTLLPAGSSPHTFEITPEQIKKLSALRVFLKVGAGLDSFGDKLAAAHTASDLITVTVMENPGLQSYLQQHYRQSHRNPHVWLDPVLVKEYIAPQIAGALVKATPENEQYFKTNLSKYCAELDALDRKIREKTAKLTHRTFISFHSAWYFFAARYDLNNIIVQEFPSQEPTPGWLAEVIETAKNSGARAVIAEPQFSTRAAEVIAAELGAPVLMLDPLGAEELPGYDSYLNLIHSNLKILEPALH
jgi:zinc transport system substrate-binding protein